MIQRGFSARNDICARKPKIFPGVLGTVADMFQMEEKYRNALEVGLGDLSHALITKNRSSAIKILKKVNELNVGDITIIPLRRGFKS